MLGFEVTIRDKDGPQPFYLNYRVGLNGADWVFSMAKEYGIENTGDAWGYPSKYIFTWKMLVEGITKSKQGHSGGIVISDNGCLSSTGYSEKFAFDPSQFDDEQLVEIELMDQS
jgi:hypothetical protein